MLAYLLDTDICIRALKRRNPALLNEFAANDSRMAVSDVTLFELYYAQSVMTTQPRVLP